MWNVSAGMNETPVLVLCVVGGVTWDEMKDILNCAASSEKKIMVVSSHISVHGDIINQLL